MNLIYEFKDGSYLHFQTGRFDDWQVEYVSGESTDYGETRSPFDADYFQDLKEYSAVLGISIVQQDVMFLADMVQTNAEQTQGHPDIVPGDIEQIKMISQKYELNFGEKGLKTFMTLYSTMISEWHRKPYDRPSTYKHLLKITGALQTIRGEQSPREAAAWTNDKKFFERIQEAKRLGIDAERIVNFRIQ